MNYSMLSIAALTVSITLFFVVLIIVGKYAEIKNKVSELTKRGTDLSIRFKELDHLVTDSRRRIAAVEAALISLQEYGPGIDNALDCTGSPDDCTGSPDDGPPADVECTQSSVRRIITPNGARVRNKEDKPC